MPELEFKGKQHIYAHHLTVPYRPLLPVAAKSVAPVSAHVTPPDGNLIIHGDNLLALKALLPRYAGRVKCIYIDPPYNTGNEGWVYSDSVNSPLMREWIRANSPVDGEDLERHDKWLCMMWPRLHLLRDLLSDDGAIFVSIDDNEQHHLRMLMDEVFGEEKFIASISCRTRGSPPNDRPIASVNDLVVIYGAEAALNLRPRDDEDTSFSNPDGDPNGPWRPQQIAANARGGRWVDSLYYAIVNPRTGEEHWPGARSNWRFSHSRVAEMIASGEIIFGRDGNSKPQRKRYLRDIRPGLTWPSIWENDTHGKFPTNRDASAELADVFGELSEFDTPKPVGLVDRILRIATGPGDIVLDSFAGSGTTAHAVLALNKEDGGNRRFILVECEEYADAITAERVRRVIRGVPGARDATLREGLGGEFAYCELGEPIGVEGMLTGESLPPFASLAAYLLHAASGISAGGEALERRGDDGLFFSADGTDYYLRYQPDIDWLRNDKESALNKEQAERIGAACRERGSRAVVFASARFVGLRDLRERKITFCQLPYELHREG